MHRPHAARPLALAAALAALAAAPAHAQLVLGPTVRVGPQFVSYDIKEPVNKTISQFAVPFSVAYPITSHFVIDLASAFASSKVEVAGGSSEISGLTDTQLRANYTLGSDALVLTAGVNIPTGQETVREDQFRAAGYIGNDFFAFPVSNLGTGLAATGGIAYARPLGSWNVGLGASARKGSAYDAFEVQSTKVRFQPGDEYRARVGLDHAVGAGRFAVGMTYSSFGDAKDAQTTYSTGDRLVTQAALSMPTGAADLFLSGWVLSRFKGQIVGGVDVPGEDIANLSLTADVHAGGALLEPNVEVRNWSRGGDRQASMATLGLRTRIGAGPFAILPGGGYTIGSFPAAADSPALSGWRASLAIRLGR